VSLTIPLSAHAQEREILATTNEKIRERAVEQVRIEQQNRLLGVARVYDNFLKQSEDQFRTLKPSEADMETVRKTLALFDGTAQELNKMRQNKASLTPEDIAYLKGFERRLIALQQKTLPGMRQAYANKVGRELWREDVYVSAGGDRNRTIRLTSYIFSANANIDDAQKALREFVTRLRFKEVQYRTYKGDNEYTRYKLDTPSDGELTYFLYGEFQDMAKGY
jgi:hypothetical protein